jgi:AcrR family transcriptional regulator
MAPVPDKMRRPGYAPAANVGVGRRGLHTRDRILTSAAEVFLASGFHGASLDTIAKAANASRATVYQYFAGKEEIFRELSAQSERAVLDHGERLGVPGPTIDGLVALHRWLVEWADIYDTHAAVFAEFPGIGTPTGLSVIDAGDFAEQYRLEVTDHLRSADLRGLDIHDAAAVLGRIPHMVNLYRYRAMFPLPERPVVSWSLSVAVQLMLFPDTPVDVIDAATPHDVGHRVRSKRTVTEPTESPAVTHTPLPPIAHDVLTVSSALFAERGYYAVGMEEIAAAAEVSRATLYRYFSTKVEILAELTRRAVSEIEGRAATLPTMAAGALATWLLGYVQFHREYRGVIRAWFDGTVADQLSDASVAHGIGAIHGAIATLLSTVALPAGIDDDVAGAVFLAVLGRMTEPTSPGEDESDEEAAALMENLLRRSLLRNP